MGFFKKWVAPIAAGIGAGLAGGGPVGGISAGIQTRKALNDSGGDDDYLDWTGEYDFTGDQFSGPTPGGSGIDIWGVGGKILDFLNDNPALGNAVVNIIAKNPELDIEQAIELAATENRLNSPNIYNPQGQSITTWDEETNQPTVTQTYSPEVQGLYETLLGNAGSETTPYTAPENFQAILGQYINDREQKMGLPMQPYKPYSG